MKRLAKAFVSAMLPWLWSADIYADGASGERANLCRFPSNYCSAGTAYAACLRDLVRHPGGVCWPTNAHCNLGVVPDSAYTIRYQGIKHHVYKFYPPACPDEDRDGIPDERDPDDDNDGVNDEDDSCPLEGVTEGAIDSDGDGCWTFPITATYHAGVCPRNLAGLPLMYRNIRHDDFQSYKLLSGSRSDKSTSGFFADDTGEAVAAAWEYIIARVRRYVQGHHRHETTSSCTLPEVSKNRFDKLRSRANELVWTNYHLIIRNCQHWAAEVVKAK